jgi:hypothetical protein
MRSPARTSSADTAGAVKGADDMGLTGQQTMRRFGDLRCAVER